MEMSAQFQNWRERGRQQAQQCVSMVVGTSGRGTDPAQRTQVLHTFAKVHCWAGRS